MSQAVDHIRAKTLAKIQDDIIAMDIEIANLTHDELMPQVLYSPENKTRKLRTAIALDEIRENVRQGYGEDAKVADRIVQLWLEIRTRARMTRKAISLPLPTNVREFKRQDSKQRSL